MRYLKQSTVVTIKMGPFLDATDGVTEEVGLTPGIEVSKDGAAFAARNSATAVAHDAEGWYDVELDGTDTDTVGKMVVKAHDSATHLPVWHEFMVLPANAYDSLVAGTDNLEADVIEWLGTAVTLSAGTTKPEVDAFSISDAENAANLLEAWTNGFSSGTVSGTPTATVFESDQSEATDDHFQHMVISFTGGPLVGQGRRITSYNGATGEFTVQPAFTEAPNVGDTFIVIPIIVSGLDDQGRTDVGAWLGTAVTLTAGVPDVSVADVALDAITASALATDAANEIRDAILSDSTPFAGANVDAAVSTRSSHAAADVAQVSLSELAQGAPPATPTIEQSLMLLYMAMRNQETQTASEYAITDDAGTVIAKATLSDDGTTVTKAEMVTGP